MSPALLFRTPVMLITFKISSVTISFKRNDFYFYTLSGGIFRDNKLKKNVRHVCATRDDKSRVDKQAAKCQEINFKFIWR